MGDPKRIQWMFTCLAMPEVELTDKEQELFESYEKQFKKKGDLTDPQLEVLEQIYNRRT